MYKIAVVGITLIVLLALALSAQAQDTLEPHMYLFARWRFASALHGMDQYLYDTAFDAVKIERISDQYFAQVWDTPEVLARKASIRQTEIVIMRALADMPVPPLLVAEWHALSPFKQSVVQSPKQWLFMMLKGPNTVEPDVNAHALTFVINALPAHELATQLEQAYRANLAGLLRSVPIVPTESIAPHPIMTKEQAKAFVRDNRALRAPEERR